MSRPVTGASIDAMFDTLRDPYRRLLLLAVLDHDTRSTDELIRDELEPIAESDADLVELRLLHVHLPKLAHRGYLEWDAETRTVRRGPNFDDVAPLLRLLNDRADELPVDWP